MHLYMYVGLPFRLAGAVHRLAYKCHGNKVLILCVLGSDSIVSFVLSSDRTLSMRILGGHSGTVMRALGIQSCQRLAIGCIISAAARMNGVLVT